MMFRLLLPCSAALAACTPSSQDVTMRNPGPAPATATSDGPAPVTVAESTAPRADSPAEAEGRRALSTAFVMLGAGGQLTVSLRDGRVLVLREVVMRRRDYCGVQASGGSAGVRYCGGYAEVASARAGGGAPAIDDPEPVPHRP